MDGNVLVLCSERPTINQYGERIDEDGHLLEKTGESWVNYKDEEVKIDETKRVISAIDMILPQTPESLQDIGVSGTIYVDWETVIPSNIEQLQNMINYSSTTDSLPADMLLKCDSDKNIMARSYFDRLLAIDKAGLRPSIDYRFQAMDDFLRLFSKTLEKNMVVSVIPACSIKDSEEIVRARIRLMEGWKNVQNMLVQTEGKSQIDLSNMLRYNNFNEVRNAASKEMMKVMSKPFFFEEKHSHEAQNSKDGER